MNTRGREKNPGWLSVIWLGVNGWISLTEIGNNGGEGEF